MATLWKPDRHGCKALGLVLNHLLPWSYIFLDVDVLLDRRKNRKLLLITVFDFH